MASLSCRAKRLHCILAVVVAEELQAAGPVEGVAEGGALLGVACVRGVEVSLHVFEDMRGVRWVKG